ncbi:MAG: ThiF family adenylyltransferase [Faecalimonas sp.]|nr:ThiF family adenylyltransferase [Faecalimonas sp.]
MLQRLLDHSEDLRKLVDEGYELEVKGSFIIVHHIPYVTNNKRVEYGSLVTNLMLNGNKTIRPSDHTIWFTGSIPCNKDGSEITSLIWQRNGRDLGNGISVACGFSNKPPQGYPDYYEKFKRYIDIISAPALSLDSTVVVQTYRVKESEQDDVFRYRDTNSSKAGICALNEKLQKHQIAIIGLGGTGSYILDYMSKTPVQQIALFDGDLFLQHNAFRAPGAATEQELDQCMTKVEYLSAKYEKMHSKVCPHAEYITEENVHMLSEYDFVFISMDSNSDKKVILDYLLEKDIPFVDTGIGLELVEGQLLGQIRTSSIHGEQKSLAERYIPMGEDKEENVYKSNIQIVELNALNAAFAVISYKKHYGFYQDVRDNVQTIYSINVGEVINYDSSDIA